LWVFLRPITSCTRRSPNAEGADCEKYPNLTLHERIVCVCVRTRGYEIAVRWNNTNDDKRPPGHERKYQARERA